MSGFLCPWACLRLCFGRGPTAGGQCAAAGFCVSLFIELCQLPLNRCSDIDDLILNTLGALAGYGCLSCCAGMRRALYCAAGVRPASGMEDAAPGLPADAGK